MYYGRSHDEKELNVKAPRAFANMSQHLEASRRDPLTRLTCFLLEESILTTTPCMPLTLALLRRALMHETCTDCPCVNSGVRQQRATMARPKGLWRGINNDLCLPRDYARSLGAAVVWRKIRT